MTPNSTLQDNLRSLRLSYLLENAVPAAENAAGNGSGHLQYLQDLIAGEVALRHDRSVQRRIQDARFPVLQTMAGWDWNWPSKLNRMQIEHLLELDFINTSTNVIFAGPTGIGTMPGTGLCRVTWHFPSMGKLLARHIPVAYLETAKEAQNTVGGAVAPWFSINGIDLSQDFLLQR
jgi:hypothetical protein